MNLKMKLEKIEEKKMAEKKNEKVSWLEKANSKNNRFATSKVYSK